MYKQAMRMVTWHIVCCWEPDCSVVLVKDVVCSGPLFLGRSFTVLTATNAALTASVYLHIHKISHGKNADFTAGICLVSVGLANSKRHRDSE